MEIKECTSLQEVREEVDKVDDEIVKLIAKRSQYVRQAAKFKHSVEEIKSDERVQGVLGHVRHKAAMLGVSPNMVYEIYEKMIDKMVEMEVEEYSSRHAY